MTTSTVPTRILAAVDFGEASASAVALAGILAGRFGARLTVFHAETMEMPPYFTDDQIETLHAERLEARARATEYVRQFAAQHTQAPFEAVVQDGPPEDAIIRAAGTFDLVVLGTHGRRGPSRWWLGSVAEAVVRAAAAPVLVTRVLDPAAMGRLQRDGAVVLAGSAAAGVERWSATLSQALHASVLQVPEIRSCPAERLGSADLVLVGVPQAAESFDDVVVDVLQSCRLPVLFVPASGPAETGHYASQARR
jgi:nucleotide-binding universal stress UspA family protein